MERKLLREVLKELKIDTGDFKPQNFTIKTILDLVNKSEDFGMVENSFCCFGLRDCCWQDVIEEGVWDFELKDVEKYIFGTIKNIKKYLYNSGKYGGPRFFIAENSKYYSVFIFLRDIDSIKTDYHIWFKKKEV